MDPMNLKEIEKDFDKEKLEETAKQTNLNIKPSIWKAFQEKVKILNKEKPKEKQKSASNYVERWMKSQI